MLNERIEILKNKIKKGRKYSGKKDRKAHERLDRLEVDVVKESTER